MDLIFEWDELKAKENTRKHRISFDEAKTVFNDPLLLTFSDEEHSDVEDRYLSIGVSAANRILLLVHTEWEQVGDILVIRLISCRRTTSAERKVYLQGIL
jgi:uncharacterized protein